MCLSKACIAVLESGHEQNILMRAVIFDFDGVLVNSEPLHFRTLRDCLARQGVTIDQDEYLRHYLAYDDRGAIRIALERHGAACSRSLVEEMAELKADLFESSLQNMPFFPGARELVGALAPLLPLGIASGALHREIEMVLDQGGLRGAFAVIVGADDVSHGKPDPEPYLAAMRQLEPRAPSLRPEECLVFEDSMPGIAAARTAGMTVVAVSHSYPPSKLGGAHLVVGSLEGLTLEGLSLRLGA